MWISHRVTFRDAPAWLEEARWSTCNHFHTEFSALTSVSCRLSFELTSTSTPTRDVTASSSMNLGDWLGRQDN